MLEKSGVFASDYMCLREIIFFREKVEKLHSQYNGLGKVKLLNGIALMYVHQETIPDTEKVIGLNADQNRPFNFT